MNRVCIAGAGLAGLYLAIALGRRGKTVRVMERRTEAALNADAQGHGRSVALALSHRGLHALAALGLSTAHGALGRRMFGRIIHRSDGSITFSAYDPSGMGEIFAVQRRELYALLCSVAQQTPGVEIHFGDGLTDWLPSDDGIMVRNASGESACHNALIGADGMDSLVRQVMEKHGYSQFHRNDFPFSYKEIGLTLSVPSPTPEGLHIWPRGAMMLIGLPSRIAGQLDGTLFLPQDMQAGWFASKAALDARWAEQFPDVPLTSLEASSAMHRPTGRIHTIQGGPWHAGRVVLVGDAAHAMTPFLGQGMNCTFEDCETLLAHIDSATDFATAFFRYSASRNVDADAIGRLSVSNLEEMMCKSATPEYAYQKNLEAWLMMQFPDTFTSCYAAITFSSTPYAKVLSMRHLQVQLMERIAELGWQDAKPEAIDREGVLAALSAYRDDLRKHEVSSC